MARGYNASADVLRNLADGTPLNTIWDEFLETIRIQNEKRSTLGDLFTFGVTRRSDTVLQSPSSSSDFEPASEYGVPQGIRAETALLPMGYTFRWFDLAKRMTWQYLADADAQQVQAVHASVLEADNRKTFTAIMGRLFNNVNGTNEDGTPVYSLWNGSDGQAPPEYNGSGPFPAAHNHYLTTGSATLTPTSVEGLIETVRHHGYGDGDGQTIVVVANPLEADRIAAWRVATGAGFDFIPSTAAPAYLTDQILVGDRPSSTFQGMPVTGSYGRALIVESTLMPFGYVACLATGGSNSDRNPIGFREHATASLQGLKLIGGNNNEYPLIDSHYVRGFGVGVRHRGAAAVLQVKASGSYTVPTAFTDTGV